MSKLSTFLENFREHEFVRILDDDKAIYEGKVGDVPFKVASQMKVIKGSSAWDENILEIKTKRS